MQGALGGAGNYRQLAEAIAPDFTIYRPDRRGRGMSPWPYTAGHSVHRDVEDVDAIRAATGARLVFGLSSGVMIALKVACRLSGIERQRFTSHRSTRGTSTTERSSGSRRKWRAMTCCQPC